MDELTCLCGCGEVLPDEPYQERFVNYRHWHNWVGQRKGFEARVLHDLRELKEAVLRLEAKKW